MFLGSIIFITALCISAVAIYYSVAGLVAIFAAAAVPIMIMGGALEIGKLVTAVWLHKYWKQATWWLKTYLSLAVVVLMFITSMGIFGFLSKAHIEQTSAGEESVAQVERLESEIQRNYDVIKRAEEKIVSLQTSGTGNDANVQNQIDKEQERIDKAFERIQPAIQEQNKIIAGVTQLFQNELDSIDEELETLQSYIDAGDIRKAQGMVGTATDGSYGPKTAAAFTAWQDAKRAERNEWLDKIQKAASSPTVVEARNEIQRLRKSAENQIANSNTLINRLRQQLGNSDKDNDIDAQVDEQNLRIKNANNEIDTLTDEKFALEGEYRKLEAEVGPIKYIAEFVYGESADKNMLEEAVRWVIIVIILVFDPLAVLLLIASQYTFEWRRQDRGTGGAPPTEPSPTDPYADNEWDEAHRDNYEYDRAKKISENKPPEIKNENDRRETAREEQQDAEELRNGQDEESLQTETGHDSVVAEEEKEQGPVENVAAEEEGSGDNTETSDGDGLTPGTYTGDTQSVPMEQEDDSQQVQKEQDLDKWNNWVEAANKEAEQESTYKIIPELQTELDQKEIPDTSNRMFYPEELDSSSKKKTYITKEQDKQVRKIVK